MGFIERVNEDYHQALVEDASRRLTEGVVEDLTTGKITCKEADERIREGARNGLNIRGLSLQLRVGLALAQKVAERNRV